MRTEPTGQDGPHPLQRATQSGRVFGFGMGKLDGGGCTYRWYVPGMKTPALGYSRAT